VATIIAFPTTMDKKKQGKNIRNKIEKFRPVPLETFDRQFDHRRSKTSMFASAHRVWVDTTPATFF
jgi:hypothetical protein